jgi:predicted TIM-barrel fold metal-dependent hydrolase
LPPVRISFQNFPASAPFIHRNDPAHISEIVADTVAIFGADRCLFGSNFPIEKLWTSYRELVDAHRAATTHLRADQRDAVLRTTAVAFIGWKLSDQEDSGRETHAA